MVTLKLISNENKKYSHFYHFHTLQVLEELGVLQRIKRLSGTSGGAIVAMLLAIEMTASQMKECLSENMRVKLMGKISFQYQAVL